MLESEKIHEDRRKAYEEQQRILFARLLSERGGMLMQNVTESEIEQKQLEFAKNMTILEYKYIDIVREDYGLSPNNEKASFGDDMEKRWEKFFKSSTVLDDKGEETILYEDVEGNYRFIPDRCATIDELEFLVKSITKIKTDFPKEELCQMPLLSILGIEALSTDKYADYNVRWDDKDFFITQILIMAMQLFDIIARHKKYLKEETENRLYRALEMRFKELF